MKEKLYYYTRHVGTRLFTFFKWLLFSIFSGISIGIIGTFFYFCMARATAVRAAHPWLIFFLPAAGLIIAGAYRFMHNEKDTGTNLVLSAIHSGEN